MAGDSLYFFNATLLHCEGANGATTFVDNASVPKSVVASGNAQITTAVKKFGQSAIAFDGTGDYLTIGVASDWSSMHQPGAKWTFEGWFAFNSFAADNVILSTSNGSTGNYGIYCVCLATSRQVNFQVYRGTASTWLFNGSFATAMPNDTALHHVAITCDLTLGSNQATMWVDGVNFGSLSISSSAGAGAASAPLKIGGYATTGNLNGYVDELRVTLGAVRYTAAFTPPTAAFADAGMMTPTTWSPTDKGSACTLSNGNLTATGVETNGTARSVFGASSGKWYWECTSTGARFPSVGIGTAAATLADWPGADTSGFAYYGLGAKKVTNNVQTAYGSTWTSGQVVGFALDLDNHTIEVYKNGVSMGIAFTGLPAATYYAMTGGDTNSGSSNCTANFGATAFAYPIPTGFNPGFGAPTSTISGNINDSTGTNAARKVFFFREDNGSLLGSTTSDPTTGNFTFATPYSGAHLCVAMPASGESANAIVFRAVLGV